MFLFLERPRTNNEELNIVEVSQFRMKDIKNKDYLDTINLQYIYQSANRYISPIERALMTVQNEVTETLDYQRVQNEVTFTQTLIHTLVWSCYIFPVSLALSNIAYY